MSNPFPSPAPGLFSARARRQGKRARTRARLMDAAVAAFAERGLEAASVNAIAEAAGVANGTFYHHFRDKDEIVGAVAFGIAGELARRIDASMQHVDDAAERVCSGTRHIVELAASAPDWGRALVRAAWSLPELRHQVAAFARADLERGVSDGVFGVEVDDLLVDVFAAMVLAAVNQRVSGEAGADAGERVAEHQLRMLGVPARRARRIAHHELAPLSLTDAFPD
jgi:AcrR family transcriptional regulator